MAEDIVAETYKFEADLDRFAKQLDVDFGLVLKKVVFDLHRKIVMRTPVRTGRARSAWIASADEPSDEAPPPFSAPIGAGAATDMALATSASLDFSEPYRVFWLSNNVPYIIYLEYGSSQQAPLGMARTAVAEEESEIGAIMGEGAEAA